MKIIKNKQRLHRLVFLSIALIAVTMSSCILIDTSKNGSETTKIDLKKAEHQHIISVPGSGIQVEVFYIEIDSCEYIYIAGDYRAGLAHKGNCKYCEARKQKSTNED